MLDAFGSAGTQAAGLWECLRDAADSKQLHTARAAANGIAAAYLAQEGFTGARHILEGPQGMAAGMSSDADPVSYTHLDVYKRQRPTVSVKRKSTNLTSLSAICFRTSFGLAMSSPLDKRVEGCAARLA